MNSLSAISRAAFAKGPLWMTLAGIAGLGMWACTTDSNSSAPAATLKIETPANGTSVPGPNVLLKVSTTQFTYAGAAAAYKVSAAQRGEIVSKGHIHVFLDKPAGLDADAITNLTKYDTTTLSITKAGLHYVIVQGADSNHVDVESMYDSVQFTVTLP